MQGLSSIYGFVSAGYKTIAVNTVIEEEFDAITGTKKKKGKANEAIPAPKVSFSKEVKTIKSIRGQLCSCFMHILYCTKCAIQ